MSLIFSLLAQNVSPISAPLFFRLFFISPQSVLLQASMPKHRNTWRTRTRFTSRDRPLFGSFPSSLQLHRPFPRVCAHRDGLSEWRPGHLRPLYLLHTSLSFLAPARAERIDGPPVEWWRREEGKVLRAHLHTKSCSTRSRSVLAFFSGFLTSTISPVASQKATLTTNFWRPSRIRDSLASQTGGGGALHRPTFRARQFNTQS